ncbi:MAG TPA: DUF2911 domain-containing protein [Flavobacteriales bacterium]|nr:DUF2911 domain-containing protein [Flavobacteriales bacterium]
MKALVLPFVALFSLQATAQDLPQASPSGSVEQVIGLTKVRVDYSRPSVKGRRIFGDLVPYGKVWRTGANKNTTIEFSGPVKIADQEIAAGKYSVFTTPNEGAWVVHLNKNTDLWGEDEYKEDENAASLKVESGSGEFTETMTFEFADLNGDNGTLVLRWEKSKIALPIVTDATQQGLANIQEALAKPDAKAGAYGSSARFCLDRNVMTKEALVWARKSVSMDKKYWTVHTLARALAANGMTEEAIATAEESLKMAQEEKSEAYVKMNRERIQEWTNAGK